MHKNRALPIDANGPSPLREEEHDRQETLRWMIEEQGMPQPEPAEYAKLLDYLGTCLAPDSPN